ncbi:hypothetical protein NZD89_18005 [Alicyclobacillus fastidiosus]|uniref:Uncharacterized protein n=1 Tax=Alicyclobacillus fastidiosus TaxID=392011 RepID=A0ABY6ZBM2_9BACL|nr:hypothetical protein [Alicyclobacillus fastidiosus]WAH40257.1 hypothetical protein NZD89_18005 [Alicyclobacillus fastidiosus]GMA61625.1 hypothetical protein GCM10025859_20650 [Alicyclobacillus fastidiosus]
MESPRKRSNRNDAQHRRGQVVDLRAYRNRRGRSGKAVPVRQQRSTLPWNRHAYIRVLCYAMMVATAVLALLGLILTSWRTQSLIWAMFLGTVGLGCGLWLNALRDRQAMRLLSLLSAAFALAYLCALLRLVS